MNHMWMENNALGYSGTNSGGTVVIENSQFDDNQDGLDTNTQVIGDPPAPQDGQCPDGGTSPITHTNSCWVVIHNYLHNNNNPTAPAAGSAAAGPVGTGMTISGGRFDTVMDNTIANNGALLDNSFSHNGYFGNPSNSDYGQITLFGGEPQNCFRGNNAPDGSDPANLEHVQSTCDVTTTAGNTGGALFAQVLCDTGLAACPPGANYPRPNGTVHLKALPIGLPTMANPCAGVPANPWCPSRGQHATPGAS